jgi:hypothetical protein
LTLNQFQFAKAKQIAGVNDIFRRPLPGELVIFSEESRKSHLFEVMFEQNL